MKSDPKRDVGVPDKPESGTTHEPKDKPPERKHEMEVCKRCAVLYLLVNCATHMYPRHVGDIILASCEALLHVKAVYFSGMAMVSTTSSHLQT